MYIRQFIKDFRAAPGLIRKLFYNYGIIAGALADPNGFGQINLMFENANIPNKYKYMFFPNEDDAIFLDCGMNVGLITDIARKMNMEVYGFEPNPVAVRLLNIKYKDDKKVHIYPCAVSNYEGKIDFFADPQSLFDVWGTIVKESAEIKGGERLNNSVKVPVKKLTDIIKKDILPGHKNIHLLKMDIEGSEFGVINDIIDDGLYKNITYIVVETHERLFKDGKTKLKNLQQRIKDNNIKNIYLDWI